MIKDRFRKGYSLVIRDRRQLTGYLPAIAEAGFDGIEPTFVDEAFPSPAEHTERAGELRRVCDDLGLEIPSMRGGAVPWSTIPSDNPGDRALALDHTRRAFESLAQMGGTVLLIVPGRRVPQVDYHMHWRRVVEYGQAAGEIAAEFGMKIALENAEARFPVSELDWRALVDEIDNPNVGIYLDVGNVLWLGFGYPEQWIRTMDHRIVQIHFRDATYRLQGASLHGQARQFLDGDVNWPAVMDALNEVSYRGWITVEPDGYRYLPAQLPARLSLDLDALFRSNSGRSR